MQLVQILLPVRSNEGESFPQAHFDFVRRELMDKFGGLTAYNRAPAEGLWQPDGSGTAHDDIVIFEVMADDLDERWWKDFRAELETLFRQDKIIVRAQEMRLL